MKVLLILSLVSLFAFSKTSKTVMASHDIAEKVYISLDKDNKPVYFMKSVTGEVTPINKETADSKIEAIIKYAKEQACSLSIKPQTVEVSVGFASLSWDTEKICGK